MTDPTITLAGVSYTIPPLVIRQNRHVEPLIFRHRDYFLGKLTLTDFSEEMARDFTLIVYHTLTRARPDLTFEQFEDMPVSMAEIMRALPVCLRQTGLFKPAAEAQPPAGEAPSPSIGTA